MFPTPVEVKETLEKPSANKTPEIFQGSTENTILLQQGDTVENKKKESPCKEHLDTNPLKTTNMDCAASEGPKWTENDENLNDQEMVIRAELDSDASVAGSAKNSENKILPNSGNREEVLTQGQDKPIDELLFPDSSNEDESFKYDSWLLSKNRGKYLDNSDKEDTIFDKDFEPISNGDVSNSKDVVECHDFQMSEPIRYSPGDPVEKWLCQSLLLEPKLQNVMNCPIPSECSLFFVNKDALFSGNSKTEEFLAEIFSLFVSSHYRNSPNDMQILSDSPNHEIFVLLTPESKIVCAIQIAFEGNCQKTDFNKDGNLIPWVIFDNYSNDQFLSSFGARVIRIAVHPSLLSMGYGSHALFTLIKYLELSTSPNSLVKSEDSSVLLYPISKIETPKIDWIGSSFGVTEKLLKFWKKLGFTPICIKQMPSKTTGEFSTVVIRNSNFGLEKMKEMFLQRFIPLLASPFRDFSPTLALSLIYSSDSKVTDKKIEFSEDEKTRLKKFAKGTIDIRSVLD
ncbi:RNA cytidine acetyltransferase-like, partial [Arctopsyche grandis]|uniref:RNA cytidine acetyltransferase-like n=1 Tax=Arctopsyche grandis TaxID=121162 RepID=UPI00406D9373